MESGTDPMARLFEGVIEEANKRVAAAIDKQVTGELEDLRKMAKESRKLEVVSNTGTHTVQGKQHYLLDDLIRLANHKLPILMVGMAGTGKTHAAEQVAEGLGLKFYAMSVGAQTSKSDIIGYMNAAGNYVGTHFREAYENGGVFLMDEIDAGNANVLIQINAALSNGMASFPDAMVKAHEDFVFIASANTYGTGANRQYVGRNQLDAATLDRFTVFYWEIDNALEQQMAGNRTNWYTAVRAAREYVDREHIRALITPRATQRGVKMLDAGFELHQVIESALLGTVPDDKKQLVRDIATQGYTGAGGGIPSANVGTVFTPASVAF